MKKDVEHKRETFEVEKDGVTYIQCRCSCGDYETDLYGFFTHAKVEMQEHLDNPTGITSMDWPVIKEAMTEHLDAQLQRISFENLMLLDDDGRVKKVRRLEHMIKRLEVL